MAEEQKNKVDRTKAKKSFLWCFVIVTLVYLVFTAINVWTVSTYKSEVEALIKNTAVQNISEIKTLLKENDRIILVEEELERAKLEVDSNYRDFLMKFYEVQNNSLTFWLAVMALIFAFFGIVIPLCFLKFFEGKSDEIEKTVVSVKEKGEFCSNEIKKMIDKVTQDLKVKRNEINRMFDEISKQVDLVNEDKNITEANKYFALGLNKYEEKKYNEALGLWSKAKTLNAKDADIINYIGNAYFLKKEYGKAIEYYNDAIDIKDEDIYYANRASAYYAMKNTVAAIKDVERALELNKENELAYAVLSGIYYDKGEYGKSLSLLDRAIEINPNRDDFYENYGNTALKLKKFELAEKMFKKASDLGRLDSIHFYNICELYLFTKRFQQALSSINKFIVEESNLFIFEDDYHRWMKQLDKAESDEDKKIAAEIKELIETKLIKKPRE